MQVGQSDILIVIVSILLSMGLHEAMHAFTSHWLGDTTAQDMGRLTINPLKHLDLYTTILLPVVLIVMGLPPIFAAKPVPFNPDRVRHDEFGVALIGAAGPFTNLFLAICAAITLRGIGFDSSLAHAIVVFMQVNVAFFVFNMIPFPPLDGSRILYAFAPEPLQEAMQRIEQMGFVAILIIFFLVINIFSGPITQLNVYILRFLLGV